MSIDIDIDSRETAFKVLIIIFIIATLIINLMLLIKYVQVPGFLNIPGICMRMAVAAGSIFLALFSYVVLAKIYFKDVGNLNCRSILIPSIYMSYVLPFVFGCSVILQCFLYLSNSFSSTLNPKIKSIAIAGIPWILGILIICPLTMAGIEWERNCRINFTLNRNRAILVISVLLPACIALLFSLILSCKPTTQNHAIVSQNQTGVEIVPMNATVTTLYPTQSYGIDNLPGYKENQNSSQYPQHDPQQYSQQQFQLNPQPYPQQHPQTNPQQYPPQHAQQYPLQNLQGYPQPYPQQYPVQNPNAFIPVSGPVIPISSQMQLTNGSTVVSPQSISSDKSGLLLASMIFIFSVMPWACFTLKYDLNYSLISSTVDFIIKDVCTWLFFLYPIFVPLVWLRQKV